MTDSKPMQIDPAIMYALVLADDDPTKTSPFQGFSRGWMTLTWAMHRVLQLPGDVLEAALPHQAVLARRISGTGGWRCFPVALKSLTQLEIAPEAPFWVVFSGTKAVAAEVAAWAAQQSIPPLHVTPQRWPGAFLDAQLDFDAMRSHVAVTLDRACAQQQFLDRALCDEALANWTARPRIDAGFIKQEHNCTLPNHMALEGAGVVFAESRPLIGNSLEIYTQAIIESADAVLDLRSEVGQVPAFRLTPPLPSVIVTAPSLFRHAYKMRPAAARIESGSRRAVNDILRQFQRQTGFHWTVDKHHIERVMASPEAKAIIQTRQEELEVHTLAVGLRGASTLAATVRVPPGVNRVAGAVRQLATHARTPEIRRPHKFVRLFRDVQSRLQEAVGPDLLQEIGKAGKSIKLVADAPLEWLPVGDLPLGLKFDTSRITSTPGNLMAGELCLPRLLRLKITAFTDVLLVSAFGADDPIRDMIPDALNASEPMWRDKLKVRSMEVRDEGEFLAALNDYDGGVLIFDGHGGHDEERGVGTLAIGSQSLDVWALRGRVRVPPVVILSACDTHAADRSHATTANAFLTLGARTVLATLLPIDAVRAAVFVGRLLFRLADFLPAALSTRGQAIVWSEVIGGMLRMQLLTDLLRPCLRNGWLNGPQYEEIHSAGNVAINRYRPDWFDSVVGQVAMYAPVDASEVRRQFGDFLPLSDTIRYIQIGNPETVIIDEPSTAQLVEADVEARNDYNPSVGRRPKPPP